MKILLISLLLILAFQVSFGQEKPKAEILDSIGPSNCEELKKRAHGFLTDISKDPNAVGYAVIYEKKDGIKRSNWNERLLMKTVELGKFNKNILKVVYGEKKENYGIEFWKVPKGVEKPNYVNEFLPDALPIPLKPFVFGYEDELDICPTFSVKTYVNILKSNPTFNTHIVVTGNPNYILEDFVKNTLKYLTKDHKISRSRIKFFFIKKKNVISSAEYWLVPKKKHN